MSISVYGRINKKCINKELFEKVIIDFFSPRQNIIKQDSSECTTYEGISEKNVIIISFINEKRPPYNVYDSNIISGEFEYNQLVIFDLKKEDAFIDRYKDIIDFLIYLKGKIKSDILITSDVHDEICLVKEGEIISTKEEIAEKELQTERGKGVCNRLG